MKVRLHKHAAERLSERGATRVEAMETVRRGRRSRAKFGRFAFVLNFPFDRLWLGKRYATKQIKAIAVRESDDQWLIVTVIVKYF